MNIFKGRKERENEKRKDREDLVEVPSYSPHDFRPLDYMKTLNKFVGNPWEKFSRMNLMLPIWILLSKRIWMLR